jgi:hypothetical protein
VIVARKLLGQGVVSILMKLWQAFQNKIVAPAEHLDPIQNEKMVN